MTNQHNPEFHRLALHSLELHKYPSTQHLEGSQLQRGDSRSPRTPYRALAGRHIVVEEKLDGANAGLSFGAGGDLLLQSRGHYLAGGARERQFAQFKRWGAAHEHTLLAHLADRYVMYGEWMAKKHSVFYDRLPHWFCEFDIYDRATGAFLSTPARRALLGAAPVLGVPVLYEGIAPRSLRDLLALLRPSLAKSATWRQSFEAVVQRAGLDLATCWTQADKSDLAEGLYIKVEEDGIVRARYKWVRADFTQSILDAQMHHARQPFVPNQLLAQADLFAPRLACGWPGQKEPDHA